MTLKERFECFKKLADKLQSTNSIVEKRRMLDQMPKEMEEDLQYIFEVLAGQHKYGFTFYGTPPINPFPKKEDWTIKQYMTQLDYCNWMQCWSIEAVHYACSKCYDYSEYIEPIANRTLRLGIGKSVLPKDGLGAMLGKSYDGSNLRGPVYITEKLDGNRCIAMWDGTQWKFTSRNGKTMKVNFSMEGLPKEYIYDGEVMSKEQTERSINLFKNTEAGPELFNATSGLINSKYGDKSNLVYNIFDIMHDGVVYEERRELLDTIERNNVGIVRDWRIVPVLLYCQNDNFYGSITDMLEFVTSKGAEGLMINTAKGFYQHKRTNDLLKFKKVQTVDLYVVSIIEGTGKYEGMVGSLDCAAKFDDGTFISCQVGTGLSDEQRWAWSINPNAIVGKIVEVAYFSKSQNKTTDGSMYYSLRFPRLKNVRNDKMEVSKY